MNNYDACVRPRPETRLSIRAGSFTATVNLSRKKEQMDKPAAIEQDSTRSRNKGGRPPLPSAPKDASDTRALIAQEIVKTKPNSSKLRHLQKLLKSQQEAEEHAEVQAAALRKNELLAEANELSRAEYQRRYQLSQRKKADANEGELTLQLKNVATENGTLRETVASLSGELARAQSESQRLADERESLMRERDALQATVNNLQPQADALALIKRDVQTELGSMLNTDERVRSLQAEFESLKTAERTMSILERMKEIIVRLKTLHHAYQVAV
jgi:hypothetical protein